MMRGYVASIESFGLLDGPGIRTVVFLGGCQLRCKYCHNPEMWKMGTPNYTSQELVQKILRNKPYFKRNHGGVTFSGGEPLLQIDFLIEVCQQLKKEQIHIALDTAGVGYGKYSELFPYIDLVLLDIKHIHPKDYFSLTGQPMDSFWKFIKVLEDWNVELWIRQVIVPGIHDNTKYIQELAQFLKALPPISKVEFLPYHKMGDHKYQELGISNPFLHQREMDQEVCQELFQEFQTFFL